MNLYISVTLQSTSLMLSMLHLGPSVDYRSEPMGSAPPVSAQCGRVSPWDAAGQLSHRLPPVEHNSGAHRPSTPVVSHCGARHPSRRQVRRSGASQSCPLRHNRHPPPVAHCRLPPAPASPAADSRDQGIRWEGEEQQPDTS